MIALCVRARACMRVAACPLNLRRDWSVFRKSDSNIMPLEATYILMFDCKRNPHFVKKTRPGLQARKSAQ
jgi:hypothetical protein